MSDLVSWIDMCPVCGGSNVIIEDPSNILLRDVCECDGCGLMGVVGSIEPEDAHIIWDTKYTS